MSEFVPIRCSPMMWVRFRVASLTVLTVVVAGGLLLMHGLDTHGSQMHPAAASDSIAVSGHGDHGAERHHDESSHCDGCMAGALMVACVAVISVFVSLSLIRRALGARGSTSSLSSWLDRVQWAVDVLRPPDPAWIRLSVVRC